MSLKKWGTLMMIGGGLSVALKATFSPYPSDYSWLIALISLAIAICGIWLYCRIDAKEKALQKKDTYKSDQELKEWQEYEAKKNAKTEVQKKERQDKV